MANFRKRADQGEVSIRKIAHLPEGVTEVQPENGHYIIGHSESGHCHVIDAKPGTRVFSGKTARGMECLYAIVENPTALHQTAATPHKEISLDAGIFEFRNAREYDPFSEQVRRVAD